MENQGKPEAQPLRRSRFDLMTPAEKAIYDAIQEVEKVGADPFLTYAVVLLQNAKDQVSNYVDKLPQQTKQ